MKLSDYHIEYSTESLLVVKHGESIRLATQPEELMFHEIMRIGERHAKPTESLVQGKYDQTIPGMCKWWRKETMGDSHCYNSETNICPAGTDGNCKVKPALQHIGAEGIGSVPTPPEIRESLTGASVKAAIPVESDQCEYHTDGCNYCKNPLANCPLNHTAPKPGEEHQFTDKQGNRIRVLNPKREVAE